MEAAVAVFTLIGFAVTAKFIGDHFIKRALIAFGDRFPRFATVTLLVLIGGGLLLYVLWFAYLVIHTLIYLFTRS